MNKQKIAIIGFHPDGKALIAAKQLAKEQGMTLIIPEEAKELGIDNLPCIETLPPPLELTMPKLADYTPTDYEIKKGAEYPKKNWKRKLKKNRRK